ncbi:MAG: PBP1A family penicillin-binding protein [Acidimicrobiia bacterium]|nr:PBP1A family penicillin-binding protein [Acidimicrobiia bacterium]
MAGTRRRSPSPLRVRWPVVLGGVAVLLSAATIWFAVAILRGLPDTAALQNAGAMSEATVAYDRHGRPAFTIFQEQRIEVPIERVSPSVVRAIVAIEDQRFYDHGGVDVIRLAGAVLNNLREGRRAQGGSTITQQLARQTFLTLDKTVRRKLKEAVVALRLERMYTKDEILELYLNRVYFGDGLYGVEAASMGFFGTPAADLTVSQAAFLAGLVQRPSAFDPTRYLDRAVDRRNLVLRVMRDADAIDDAAYRSALAERVHLADGLRPSADLGGYYWEEVRQALVEQFGVERVHHGGLRVYTTFDPLVQAAAEQEVARALAEIEERRAGRNAGAPEADPIQAALVAIEPATGEVRAMVGGRSFAESRFNRAMQARRQPGSAFKAFVYASALERGYSAATVIGGLDVPIETAQGDWVPEDEHAEGAALTMRTALRTSSNRAAVRMLQDVGIAETVYHAQQLGMGALPGVPSLALGSGEVTLLSMTRAFAAFANGGVLETPVFITRVETADGEILYEAQPQEQPAVSPATAFILTSMLADVVDRGTGWTARQVGFTRPAAGKTGTTNDFHDAWFVGYTPHLAAGVWVGYDQPRTIVRNGYAAQLAVPLWGRFMVLATADDPDTPFEIPEGVVQVPICRLSGMRAHDACRHGRMVDDAGNMTPAVYGEYFAPGTEPLGECTVHRQRRWFDMFAGGSRQPPPSRELPLPAAPAPAADLPAAAAVQSPSDVAPADVVPVVPPKKRGFWSRVFGIGGGDRDD